MRIRKYSAFNSACRFAGCVSIFSGIDQDCVDTCMETTYGFSSTCSPAFGELADCGFTNCKTVSGCIPAFVHALNYEYAITLPWYVGMYFGGPRGRIMCWMQWGELYSSISFKHWIWDWMRVHRWVQRVRWCRSRDIQHYFDHNSRLHFGWRCFSVGFDSRHVQWCSEWMCWIELWLVRNQSRQCA